MKKLMLFLLMIMSPSLVLADDIDFVKDGIAYKILSLNPAQLEVVAKEGGYEGNIIIPDNVSYENVEFTVTSIGKKAFNRNNITGIILPSKLKIIHESAFALCSGIKKLELPKELETIEASAFVWCEIDSLVIPGSIRKLSTYCFACNKLEYLELEEGITIIPRLAFSSCYKLRKVVLPSSLTKIEAAAFDDSPLKVVISKRTTSPTITGSYWFSGGRGTHTLYNPFTYADSNDRPICVLVVPSGAKDSYKSITTQDNKAAWPVETIEEYNEETDFSLIGTEFTTNDNNYIITNVGSTNNVQLIGNTDSDITKISIPVSVEHRGSQYTINSINSTYYSQKKQIRDVTIYNDLPLEINANTFSSMTYLMGHLYVPKGKVNAYKEAIGWKDFSNIAEIKDKYKLIYMIGGELYKSFEIEEGSSITPEPAPTKEGYSFSGWSEIPETMPARDVTVTGSFAINKYKLVYKVDDADYKTYELEFGALITPESSPIKEGYTFSGWSEIPKTMPAHDVIVTGTFTINKYKLTYIVDGDEYKSYELDYGATITPEPAPTKEGDTFSGWSEIPETMPAHYVTVTGTFTINKYKLVYKVDGAEYKSYEIEYGAKITPETAPIKEGYTFSGWSEIPEAMPAHEVTVTGTFSINKYKLTYMVDGEEYKSYELEFGATITPEAEPTKEGYTFSGWSEIPETMPAHEVMVTGTFSVNKYKLTYTVDGEEYKSYKLDYGASITPEAALTKEGYTFSGWSEIPETMPAHDVTVTGTFSINSYKLTYMIDDKVYKETMYEYGETITPEPQPEGDYATFEWIDLPQTMPARDVVVYASYTSGIVELLMPRQQNVRVYSTNGKRLNSPQKGVNIIRMSNGRTKKIVVK